MNKENEIKDHLHNSVWVIEQFAEAFRRQRPLSKEQVAIMADKYLKAREYLDSLE